MSDLYNSILFPTPVWDVYEPKYVKPLIKATDSYIQEAKKRNKKYKDFCVTHHSTKLYEDPRFMDFIEVVVGTSYNFLDSQGFDLSNFKLSLQEMWVQEFAKKGGGSHNSHVHWNQQVSGFYFLKCSDKTSMPIFHDPRPGALMTKLPMKNSKDLKMGAESVNFNIKPGTFLFFPGYLTHEFPVDRGVDPFRFIHFNLQAIHTDVAK